MIKWQYQGTRGHWKSKDIARFEIYPEYLGCQTPQRYRALDIVSRKSMDFPTVRSAKNWVNTIETRYQDSMRYIEC